MRNRYWTKIGDPRILAEDNGKRLINQQYLNPLTDKYIDYSLFDASFTPVIIFPLTVEMELVAIRQFRPAIEDMIIELPGGNSEPEDENSVKTAERELIEETGYQADKLIRLPTKLWIEPGACTSYLYSFLALGCEKKKKPKNDENEDIETLVIPLPSWMDMITRGEISDMKTIAITLLATSLMSSERRT